MPRPHTSRIKLYKDVPEEAKRGVCCHIVNVQEFLVTLSRIRRITLCEAELQQVDFSNLECGLERINPTVVCVARTLDELGLDDALRVLLPYVSGLDREALSANITQRRSRQAVTSESSDFEAVSQFKMPTRPLNASSRSSTLATVIVRKEETAAHDELQNSSDFDHLLHILLSFETARFNTGLMRFEQGLVDPFSVVSGQVDRVSRRCTDLARQVFVCSPDDCDSTKAALTELSTLLQFRHPNITPLIAYAFNEALCQEDILVLELYTPWYTGGTLRSLLISSEIASISADRRLDILCKVAKVLAFMHSEDPYSASHGNLSSAKVLLSHGQEPVLSDFTSSVCSCGPSVLTESTDLNSELASSQSSAAGVPTTLRESMRSDCFKFATLCLEVWLHQEPEPGAWYPPDESISSLKLAERVSEQFHETGTFMVNTLTPDTVPFDGWEPDEHQALLAFAVGCLDENNRDQAMSMTQLSDIWYSSIIQEESMAHKDGGKSNKNRKNSVVGFHKDGLIFHCNCSFDEYIRPRLCFPGFSHCLKEYMQITLKKPVSSLSHSLLCFDNRLNYSIGFLLDFYYFPPILTSFPNVLLVLVSACDIIQMYF